MVADPYLDFLTLSRYTCARSYVCIRLRCDRQSAAKAGHSEFAQRHGTWSINARASNTPRSYGCPFAVQPAPRGDRRNRTLGQPVGARPTLSIDCTLGGSRLAVGGDVAPLATMAAKSIWPNLLVGVDLIELPKEADSALPKAIESRPSPGTVATTDDVPP